MSRIFMFAYEKCYGDTGGGQGVVYRLYRANQKYRMIDNIYFVFGDRVVKGTSDCGELAKISDERFKSLYYQTLKKIMPNCFRGIIRKKGYKNGRKRIMEYLIRLNDQYHFTQKDIYIFHDLQTAEPFTAEFHFSNVMMVSHTQGSMYHEWMAKNGCKSPILRKFYNDLFISTVKKLKYLGFPSKGAEESMIASEPEFKEIIFSASRKYIYSGISIPDLSRQQICEVAGKVKKYNGLKFATVAALNEAKAVERIPEYLYALKKKGYDLCWVLVGKGIKESEVRSKIEKYDLRESVIWVNDYIDHNDILQILSVTDFYILLHRYSIFDLSTLEAMHYGNIPVLTPTGGNKEVILEDNGIFVRRPDDVSELEMIINDKNRYRSMKETNKRIQREYYNDYAFLKRYADLCCSFETESQT